MGSSGSFAGPSPKRDPPSAPLRIVRAQLSTLSSQLPSVNPPDLVQELGHRLNLTGLTLNGGVCRLVFDQSLPIDLEDDGLGNLCFHTVVAPLPHEGREALFSAL